jgi:hypothetical protein
MEGKRGYAVMMAGGNVYQDRMGRYEFSWLRCTIRTAWPRHACFRGTVHRMPFRGSIPGYIPPWVPEGSWLK